jgi:hypothetical protein
VDSGAGARIGDDDGKQTFVAYSLAPHGAGTRLTFEHTGFSGIGGFVLTRFIMGPGWKTMLSKALAAVLDDLDESGQLRAGSALRPRS